MKWQILSTVDSQSHEPVVYEDAIEADGFWIDEGGICISFYVGDPTKKDARHVAVFNRDAFVKAIQVDEQGA